MIYTYIHILYTTCIQLCSMFPTLSFHFEYLCWVAYLESASLIAKTKEYLGDEESTEYQWGLSKYIANCTTTKNMPVYIYVTS